MTMETPMTVGLGTQSTCPQPAASIAADVQKRTAAAAEALLPQLLRQRGRLFEEILPLLRMAFKSLGKWGKSMGFSRKFRSFRVGKIGIVWQIP